jgi:hypothetical protein
MSDYGKASNELFTQFVARIAQEIPTATLAMFSKLKYVNAPNFEKFRQAWNAQYLGGFIVHSKAFDGLKGDFPIGFLVWATNQNTTKKSAITEINTEVLDKKAQAIGEKAFYNLPNSTFLNVWLIRPKKNKQLVLPLKNGITPATSVPRVDCWSDGAIAYMYCGKNDLQHTNSQTVLFSSSYGQGDGFYLTSENLWQAAVIFSGRRLIKPTWINDRDQFLQPNQPLSDEFKTDCLIWMLFNGSNLTASADDLAWNGKKWSIVNHFIPYTEAEVNAPERFESDFMVQYLADLQAKQPEYVDTSTQEPSTHAATCRRTPAISLEAQAILDAGRVLWQAYFAETDVRSVRDELKLNRPDVGWYQIRNALKARNTSGDNVAIDFKPFETAYKTLTDKLQPQVFELGFLRV